MYARDCTFKWFGLSLTVEQRVYSCNDSVLIVRYVFLFPYCFSSSRLYLKWSTGIPSQKHVLCHTYIAKRIGMNKYITIYFIPPSNKLWWSRIWWGGHIQVMVWPWWVLWTSATMILTAQPCWRKGVNCLMYW